MCLMIKDFKKFHKACTTMSNKKSLLSYANYNLQDTYYNKAMPQIESKIDGIMDKWRTSKINKLKKNNEKINIKDIDEELTIHRMKVQKILYKQEFENYFKGNVKEFDDLGLELTMGWVK